MNDERTQHWNAVYAARDEPALTWFEAQPTLSLQLIRRYVQSDAPVIDIGGGASRLVDALLDAGFQQPGVLDLSEDALRVSRQRLGERAASVDWIVANVCEWQPTSAYALWHDRAAFHFLVDPTERQRYLDVLDSALQPGGVAVIATFADDGPEKCSNLPVQRYSPEALAEIMPANFSALESRRHVHRTPMGNEQRFQYSVFRKASA